MDHIGAQRVEAALRPQDADMPLQSWIEPENFNPGYLMRDMDKMPKRGDRPEWMHNQDYWSEKEEIPAIDYNAGEFVYDGNAAVSEKMEAAE